ncbi:MAG: hypothetical protein EA442_01510 [Candidatus Nitrosopelagicus sp.]|nr:MAG: hypothetical protein EA442_01510 [Candidatus Nitrosopelagicus sp.]
MKLLNEIIGVAVTGNMGQLMFVDLSVNVVKTLIFMNLRTNLGRFLKRSKIMKYEIKQTIDQKCNYHTY